jgi:heat shock protein HtpX
MEPVTHGKSLSYTIETEVPSNYMKGLLYFVYRKYIVAQKQRFVNVSRMVVNGSPSLEFTVLDLEKETLNVKLIAGTPIKVEITLVDETVSEASITAVKQDLIIAVELFEEKVREGTLYFAWREGEEMVPEELLGKEKKPINRLFLETQILLAIVFLILSVFLFFVVGWLAPLVLLAVQFAFVFNSSKFIERMADWRITRDNPFIHILEYHLPLREHDEFVKKFSRDKLKELKKEVYEQLISTQGEIDCAKTSEVFLRYGLKCNPENFTTRKVNVYDLVERTADKFGFPMPEIVVSNTSIPNAAASGPSPNRSVVLITTGLLVQLEDDEILSVLGHEFGHLKGHDSLFLYGLNSAALVFSFYFILPSFPFIFDSYLFLLYFWAVMTVTYFIAKFFEARADLISAIVVGQPKILAEALEKIGFKRLLYERVPLYRFQEWITLEPHPPIYFRVDRLEKLEEPVNIKHPLFRSAKDVTNGFIAAL